MTRPGISAAASALPDVGVRPLLMAKRQGSAASGAARAASSNT